MWTRRIGYAIALAAALFGQLVDIGYLFHFVFILMLCLPLVGLAISLPSMLGCTVTLTASSRLTRGESLNWEVRLSSKGPLPLSQLCGRLRVTNVMTGEKRRLSIRCPSAVGDSTVSGTWKAGHSGKVVCSLEHLRMCDCLGLFAWPVKAPKEVSALVYPVAEDAGRLTIPEEDTTNQLVYRGMSTQSDAYDLRDYRPGDRIRSIHWKLTAKRDETVVREPLELKKPQVVLTFDHFGPMKTVERSLGRLMGFAAGVLELEREFDVCWLRPGTGAFQRFTVTEPGDWEQCMETILSERAPRDGKTILGQALPQSADGAVHQIHITGKERPRDDRG